MSTGNPFGLPDWAIDLGPQGADVGFDEFLQLESGQPEKVWTYVEPAFLGARDRAFKPVDLERITKTVGLVLANAIVASAERNPRVHYSRSETSYRRPSPYAPVFLKPKVLRRVVDTLTEIGLLEGRVAPAGPSRGQNRSVYWIHTGNLADLEREIGVRLEPARDEAAAPTLILKDGKQRVPYDASEPELESLAGHVRRVNQQLCNAPLMIEGAAQEAVWPARRRRLTRVFTGDWRSCGRFFGGAWQTMRAAERHRIRINGNETVELDFQGFMPRALYHLEGQECAGDPYNVPLIREAAEHEGLDWEQAVRPTVKVMFQRLMNQKTRRGLSKIEGLPSTVSWRSAYDGLIEKHGSISHRFFTQPSLSLMHTEAQICSLILEKGLSSDIIILPIHDSFIVEAKHEEWLRNAMTVSYREILHYEPVIR